MPHIHVHFTKHRVTRAPAPLTRDAADIKALYADLWARMGGALAELKARGKDNEWNEELHPRASNGQFGSGDKPTTTTAKGGMDKIRELLGSGHKFSKDEFLGATGLNEKRLSDYLAMLKNPKWAGKAGALKIERDKDGMYFVAAADGTPAPAPEVKTPAVVVTPPAQPPVAAPPPVSDVAKSLASLHREAGIATMIAVGLEREVKPEGAAWKSVQLAKANIRESLMHADNAAGSNPPTETYVSEQLSLAKGYLDHAIDDLNESKIKHAKEQAEAKAAEAKTARQEKAKSKAGTKFVAESPRELASIADVFNGKAKPYVDQPTAKEAAEWAVTNGYASKADWGKASVEVANAHMRSVSEHYKDFPQLRQRSDFIGSTQGFYADYAERQWEAYKAKLKISMPSMPEGDLEKHFRKNIKVPKTPARAWAMAHRGHNLNDGHNAITWNEKFATKAKTPELIESLKRSEASRWHPVGCGTMKSIADHKLGHQLDNLLGLRTNPQILALRKEAFGGRAAHTARTPYEQVDVPIGPEAKEKMTAAVSFYAASNTAEFIAEAWSEYRNNPNPRPTAQAVGDFIKAEYARKFPAHS